APRAADGRFLADHHNPRLPSPAPWRPGVPVMGLIVAGGYLVPGVRQPATRLVRPVPRGMGRDPERPGAHRRRHSPGRLPADELCRVAVASPEASGPANVDL